MERFRRFTPLLLGFSLLRFPTRLLRELFELPERDWESLLRRVLRRMVEMAPRSLIRERRLPDGSVIREVGPIVWGFSFKLDSEGKPIVRSFGNVRCPSFRFEPFVSEYREPLYDLAEEDRVLKAVIELPGASKEEIKVTATERTLTVSAKGREQNYYSEIELPFEVEPGKARSTYSNGILEVTLPRREYPPKPKGEPIKIE